MLPLCIMLWYYSTRYREEGTYQTDLILLCLLTLLVFLGQNYSLGMCKLWLSSPGPVSFSFMIFSGKSVDEAVILVCPFYLFVGMIFTTA